MTTLPSSALQAFHPATFVERGAAVPFTSPHLAGARVRRAPRSGIELIVPNPSGGRGAYVLPWTSLRDFCRPSVHDIRLNEGLAELTSVTPDAVRQAARAVALAGLAGRVSAAAARQAVRAEAEARVVANFDLLLRLVQQVEPRGATRLEDARPAEQERRAKQAITRVASLLGWTPDTIATHLEALAPLMCELGIGSSAAKARLPQVLAIMEQVRQELSAWAPEHMDGAAPVIAAAAELTLRCANDALAAARAATDQVLELLTAWHRDAASVRRRMARPDWLVDGWEQICLVWRHAPRKADRAAALHEMALLLPPIPREAGAWAGSRKDTEALPSLAQIGPAQGLNEDWRTGVRTVDLIARNEHLKAITLQGGAITLQGGAISLQGAAMSLQSGAWM